MLFVRLFDLCLFGFICFLFHLVSGMGYLSCECGTLWAFLLPFKQSEVIEKKGKRKVQGVPQSQTAALPRH